MRILLSMTLLIPYGVLLFMNVQTNFYQVAVALLLASIGVNILLITFYNKKVKKHGSE